MATDYNTPAASCASGGGYWGLEQWLCALLWPFERLAAVGA